jgi:hypothetical protein
MCATSTHVALFLFVLLALPGAAQPSPQPQVIRRVAPETKRDPALEQAIRAELGNDSFSYAYNRVKLSNATAPEVLVYLPGSDYCGSGGCTTLIFAASEGSYRLVSRITLTRTPILVSPHRTNGWNDLILLVSGGGIPSGYYAVLQFDGRKYPENPTVAPAAPLRNIVKAAAYLTGTDKPGSVIVVSH